MVAAAVWAGSTAVFRPAPSLAPVIYYCVRIERKEKHFYFIKMWGSWHFFDISCHLFDISQIYFLLLLKIFLKVFFILRRWRLLL